MIDTDEEGQRKLDELLKHLDEDEYSEYETRFLDDMKYKGIRYKAMSAKQKSLVGSIYDKWWRR